MVKAYPRPFPKGGEVVRCNNFYSESELRRRGQVGKGNTNGAECNVLANGTLLRYLPHAESARQFATLCIINSIAATGIGEFFAGSIVEFNGHNKRVGVFINELGETRQRHHRRAKLAPRGSIDVRFLSPMHVERPDECRALSAVVVQAEQLEAGIVACAQVAFYLIFISQHLQLSTGVQETFCQRSHSIVGKQVAENFEVTCFVSSRVLIDFLEIREGTPLALLMGNDGRLIGLCVTIVARKENLVVIVIVGVWRVPIPVEAACPTLHMIFRTIVPGPTATNGGTAIHLRRIVLLHGLHPVVAVGHPVASGLVACRHHDERRMVAVGVDDALRLLEEIFVDDLSTTQTNTVIRPRRSLGLQVETHLVCSGKGGFGRTIAVEAHVVQSVLATFLKDAQPRSLIGGRIARLGEATVLHRSTHPDGLAIEIELAPLYADVADAEGYLPLVITYIYVQSVQMGMKLVPKLCLTAKV